MDTPPIPKTEQTQTPTMEEQEKELLYWESQYQKWFDKIEEKNKKLLKYHLFKTILRFKQK
jgi:hypothetical protein